MKILIVDDSRSSRLMVKTCLKEFQCEIDEADGGESALEKFKSGHFDLVIMDIHMPKMDGYETTKRIRGIEAMRKSGLTPIIALTAMDPAQAAPRTKAAGATTCLSKPVKQAVLVEAINSHVKLGPPHAPATAAEPPKEPPGRFAKLFGRKEAESDGLAQDGLRDLRPAFLIEKDRELRTAMLALDGGDLETVRLLAHRLKGEGANFGFKEVSDLGAALAVAAEAREVRIARATLQKLHNCIAKADPQAAA
jgi:CheY-like chemotaxis protein/HPt (histidine-containing phosphotransfer) domain-containing protein